MTCALLLFEISDKEFPLEFIWIFSLIVAIGGFFLVRLHPIFFPIPLFFAILFGIAQIQELNDPAVADAIRSELGDGYVIQSYVAIAISILMPIFGIAFFVKRIHAKQAEST